MEYVYVVTMEWLQDLRVTVGFFNDGFLDVWWFMTRVGIEQRLGFAKVE